MRILYIGWADHVHLTRWVSYFAKAGHKTWVLSPCKGRIAGAPVYQMVTKQRGCWVKAQELKIYAKLLRADIVHAHWASFGALPALAGIKPYVVTVWGSDIYRFPELSQEDQDTIRIGLMGAALVTADSVDLKKKLEGIGVVPEKIEVVQWGVDLSKFYPGVVKQYTVERLVGKHGKIVYSPRNLDKIYNQDIVLKALSLISATFPDIILVQKHYKKTSSEIDDYIKLEKYYGVENNVKLIGDIEYSLIPDFYRMANVVVSVPSSDGTPMSILESMACGTLPIVSDLASLREWITNEVNGFIVPVRDAEALASCLLRALGDEHICEQGVADNVLLMKRTCDHDKNMLAMEQLYLSVAQ